MKTLLAPSGIHGLGLFAAEFIPRGTAVWAFHPAIDRKLLPAEVDLLPTEGKRFVGTYAYVELESELAVLCGDDARYFNHSESPNTASVQLANGDYADLALSDIEEGEELTCDYRTFDARWAAKIEPAAEVSAC